MSGHRRRRPIRVGAEVRAVVVVVHEHAEVARLVLRWDDCDLSVVDALARLGLAARRHGWSVHVREATPDLHGLLRLVGLADVLARDDGLRREVLGQAEGGEQADVEEVVVADDPVT